MAVGTTPAPGGGKATPAATRSALTAVVVGSVIEWYDFYVFGTAAALVFGKIFFPSVSETSGVLLAFATFGVAFIARPFGGLVLGHLGDKIGRKNVLLATLIMMGAATVGIGLTPDFRQIGWLAPALLVLFRLVQGIGASGEWAGAALAALENAPEKKRALYASLPNIGVPIGLGLSTAVTLFFYTLPEDALLSWGWRMPFLVSIVFIAVGVWIRRNLPETKDFTEVRSTEGVERFPFWEVVRHYWRESIIVFFAQGTLTVVFFMGTTYMLSYATREAGFSQTTALFAVIIAAVVLIVTIPVVGRWSDRVGYRTGFLISTLSSIVLFAVIFPLVDSGNVFGLFLGVGVLVGVVTGLGFGSQASFYAVLFPTRVRYTGMTFGFQLSGAVFGGPLPLVAAALVAATGGSPWLLITVIGAVSLTGALATLAAGRTSASQWR